MKRKILEITEIDCLNETCGDCKCGEVEWCKKFSLPLLKEPKMRLPECLAAEWRYKENYIDPTVKYRIEPA